MIIRRQKNIETAEENKVEQANCPQPNLEIRDRTESLKEYRFWVNLHIGHNKYSVWALALKAMRL